MTELDPETVAALSPYVTQHIDALHEAARASHFRSILICLSSVQRKYKKL